MRPESDGEYRELKGEYAILKEKEKSKPKTCFKCKLEADEVWEEVCEGDLTQAARFKPICWRCYNTFFNPNY